MSKETKETVGWLENDMSLGEMIAYSAILFAIMPIAWLVDWIYRKYNKEGNNME